MQPEKSNVTFLFVFKPILLFFCAYVLCTSLHEASHAFAALGMGIPSKLYHFYVNMDRGAGTVDSRSLIAAAGPLTSLVTGILFLLGYRGSRQPGLRLFLLYAVIISIGIFLGNLFSATFAGDVHRLALLQQFSPEIKYLLSFLGLVLTVLFMWRMGKEFLRFSMRDQHSRIRVIVYTILIPWLGGMVLLALAFWPLPSELMLGLAASSGFWLFTLMGALAYRKELPTSVLLPALRWTDLLFFLAAVALVRIMAGGITVAA